jgi:hypothetical protein
MLILAEDPEEDFVANHFVNALNDIEHFYTLSGATGEIGEVPLQPNRRTRGFDFQ